MQNTLITNKLRWVYITGLFIILLLPLATLPPWFYPPDWGKTLVFRSVLAILSTLLIYQLLWRKVSLKEKFIFLKQSKIAITLVALYGVFLLATLFSVDPYFSFWASPARGGGFITFCFYLVFTFMAFIIFEKKDWTKAWLISLGAGMIVCLIAIIQFYHIFNTIIAQVDIRPSSTIGNPIFLGIYLLLLFFPTLALALKEKNWRIKIWYTVPLLLFTYTILISGSRSAYAGLLVGLMYFLFFYSKKYISLKLIILAILAALGIFLYFVNTNAGFAQILKQNRTIDTVVSRLSFKAVLGEERYAAWKVEWRALQDRPILGYGPENLSVGFDKYFDPKGLSDPWWDRAHNIFLDTASNAGILGVLAYICLFVALFWQIRTIIKKDIEENYYPMTVALPATLIAYLVANFFSFDSFPTYLLFFLIIGYVLHVSYQQEKMEVVGGVPAVPNFLFKSKKFIMGAVLVLLVIFLWQYNWVPFHINKQLYTADILADYSKCDAAFSTFEGLTKQSSYLDAYVRTDYVKNMTENCLQIDPAKELAYATRGIALLKEAVVVQPLYVRYWLFLGSFSTIAANGQSNPATKASLLKEAVAYFDKAESMAPKHYEIFIERAKMDAVAQDYGQMKLDAQKCIDAKPYHECYWMKALSELYVKDEISAQQDIDMANKTGFEESLGSLYQLNDVYVKTNQFDKLVGVYEKLIYRNPNVADYHSSLAFAYYQLHQYQKARQEAMLFLQLMPSAKDEVDQFLKLLPR